MDRTGSERTSTHKQRGFTLLEVMMAMAIFTIGILGVVGMQHLVVRGNASGNAVTQQLMLAQMAMERMKHTTDVKSINKIDLNGVDMEGQAGGPYTVTSRVINLPAFPPGNGTCRYLQVTVTKAGLHGHPVTIRSVTHGRGI